MTNDGGVPTGARVDLFTCYSRRDREYVASLVRAVRAADLLVWVDLEAIPPADPDWPATVDTAIVAAPAFLFVASPDSLKSDQCHRELAVAIEHHKQLIVVAHRKGRKKVDLEAIRRSNWIPGGVDELDATVARITIAYSTDLAWKRFTVDLDVAATRWRDRERDSSYLLRGSQLDQAEAEIAAHTRSNTPPTPLELEFLAVSRDEAKAAGRREADDDRVAVATDWLDRDATTAALVLLEVEEPDATPFAVERMNEVLGRGLLEFELPPNDGLSSIAFSPDGRLLAVGSWGSRSAVIWSADGRGSPIELADGSQVDFVEFSRDSKRIVTSGNSGWLKVWRSDGRGRPIVIDEVGDAAYFSPAGDAIALLWDDGRAIVRRGRRFVERIELKPEQVFSYEVDDTGWRTRPAWLYGRDISPSAPGSVLRGPPGWFSDRARISGFSPSGDRIVVGSLDGAARLWRLDDREPIAVLRHDEAVLSASFSPDGSRIATASYDGSARLWSADGSGQPIEFRHGAPVILARFSPDGDRIVTSCTDKRVRVWRADGAGEPIILSQPFEAVDVTFSPDGDRIIVAAGDRIARVYPMDGLGDPLTLPHGASVTVALFSPDGERVATGSQNGTTRVWSTRSVELTHDAPVRSVVYSADGSTIGTVTANDVAYAWAAGRHGRPDAVRHAGRVNDVALSADGRLMATASSDHSGRLVRVGSHEPGIALPHPDEVLTATFGPDGRLLATTCRDGLLRLWVANGSEPVVLGPPGSYKGQMDVRCVAFSGDGRRVLAASGPTVRIWPIDGSEPPVALMAGHYGGYIEHVDQAFFAAGDRGVIHVVSNVVRVWRTLDDEPVEVRHPTGTSAVAISADRRWAATASTNDRTILIWNLETLQPLPAIHTGPVQDVRFSPLGSRVAVLTGGQTIPVWTIASRSSVELVHDGRIVSLDFSPDDERIVTVSEDGSARAWRADTPSEPVVVWHEGPVNGLDFSPDSNQIVTASEDGTARLWWLSGASLREQLRGATQHCLRPEFRERYLAEPSVEALRKYESCAGAAGTGEDGGRPGAG